MEEFAGGELGADQLMPSSVERKTPSMVPST
jgi:hypothetical protein